MPSARVQHACNTYSGPIQHPCRQPAACVQVACRRRAARSQHTCCLRAGGVLHAASTRAACLLPACRWRAACVLPFCRPPTQNRLVLGWSFPVELAERARARRRARHSMLRHRRCFPQGLGPGKLWRPRSAGRRAGRNSTPGRIRGWSARRRVHESEFGRHPEGELGVPFPPRMRSASRRRAPTPRGGVAVHRPWPVGRAPHGCPGPGRPWVFGSRPGEELTGTSTPSSRPSQSRARARRKVLVACRLL
jgi:hypothetical protein